MEIRKEINDFYALADMVWSGAVDTIADITRCTNYASLGIENPKGEKKHNYVFVCEDCGQVIVRERASKFTKNYHAYRCGKCDGKFKFDAEKSNYQLLTTSPKYSYIENR